MFYCVTQIYYSNAFFNVVILMRIQKELHSTYTQNLWSVVKKLKIELRIKRFYIKNCLTIARLYLKKLNF